MTVIRAQDIKNSSTTSGEFSEDNVIRHRTMYYNIIVIHCDNKLHFLIIPTIYVRASILHWRVMNYEVRFLINVFGGGSRIWILFFLNLYKFVCTIIFIGFKYY